jgi:hypothetical protein
MSTPEQSTQDIMQSGKTTSCNQALPKSKYDQFHRYLVVNRDCMEETRPKKKLKTITMDKTL